MVNDPIYYVSLCSHNHKIRLLEFRILKAAEDFCEFYNYEYEDDNNYLWRMEIDEYKAGSDPR